MADKKYSYNRIVVVGNGFDLSLGLESSYNDFILNYVKESFIQALVSPVNNRLIKVDKINYSNNEDLKKIIKSFKKLEELNEKCKGQIVWNYKGLLDKLIKIKNLKNWVDIEKTYFNLLLTRLEVVKILPEIDRDYSSIIQLNLEFEELSNELRNYIQSIESKFKTPNQNFAVRDFIDKLINKDSISNTKFLHDKNDITGPENILFVNFNYTNTLSKILNSFHDDRIHLNHIHGESVNPENPIIFGYGDDIHIKYRELEEDDENASLKFIKTFYYSYSMNYLSLIEFLQSAPYEVYIVGHSCGLSDRTLLNTIFDGSNCKLMKIFHFGSDSSSSYNDYFQKSIAVSRHCFDKQLFRKKLLKYDQHAIIPQIRNYI